MATSRTTSYTHDEDKHLCGVYLEISQDPITGINQTSNLFWSHITDKYNSTKPNTIRTNRNQRSLQSRMNQMKHEVSKLNGCIKQVELRNQSGTSYEDTLFYAKDLFFQDNNAPFKFDHVWPLLKDFIKLGNTTRTRRVNMASSQSDASMPESPISSSPGIHSFNINLSDENDGDSPPSMRLEGVKKSKQKRKISGEVSHALEFVEQSNKRIEDLINEANIKTQTIMDGLTMKREDKILMINLETFSDPIRREYFQNEQYKILQKRSQVAGPSNPSNMFGHYFHYFEGRESDLPDY